MGFWKNVRTSFTRSTAPVNTIKQPITVDLLAPQGVRTAGVDVTSGSVQRIAAVMSSVNVISQDLAKMPIYVMQQDAKGKRVATSHSVHTLLRSRPNSEMSPYTFIQLMFRTALLRGNAFAQIVRDGAGSPIALYPLHPDYVQIYRRPNNDFSLIYQVYGLGGVVTLDPADVIHLKGDTDDGIVGNSPIKQHALTFGTALAIAEFGAKFFENGATLNVAVVVPPSVASSEKETKDRFKEQFEGRHRGVDGAFNPVYLDAGGDIKPISVTPEQAQYLDTRKFERSEIAGLYRVPPHKIGDLDRSTNNNIETQERSYVNDALMPWAVQFEQEVALKLFTEAERKTLFVKFNFDALYRGDMKTRFESYHLAIADGWMNRNEARDLEDWNPVDGLDEYLVPLNMATASGTVPASQGNNGQRSVVGTKDEQRSTHAGDEQRSAAQAALTQHYVDKRRTIRGRFAGLMQTELERLIKREAQDVLVLAKKTFKTRGASEFTGALSSFYDEHSKVMVERLTPTIHTLADSISFEAKEEVRYAVDVSTEIRRFVDDYMRTLGDTYARLSRIELEDAVQKAIDEGRDPVEAIQQVLDNWQQERAADVAQRESVDLAEAAAHLVWKLAGVTEIIWHTSGSETCPACKSLDGKRVAIEKAFFEKGVTAEVEGADGQPVKLTMSHNVKHPPIHGGCDCSTSPGL